MGIGLTAWCSSSTGSCGSCTSGRDAVLRDRRESRLFAASRWDRSRTRTSCGRRSIPGYAGILRHRRPCRQKGLAVAAPGQIHATSLAGCAALSSAFSRLSFAISRRAIASFRAESASATPSWATRVAGTSSSCSNACRAADPETGSRALRRTGCLSGASTTMVGFSFESSDAETEADRSCGVTSRLAGRKARNRARRPVAPDRSSCSRLAIRTFELAHPDKSSPKAEGSSVVPLRSRTPDSESYAPTM